MGLPAGRLNDLREARALHAPKHGDQQCLLGAVS
jgi:hypothetical protein